MSDPRPEPLVPAEVDLRDFAFMPLDVVRLRDSDLAAEETPEACWAAVLLWAASWHQVPAASIPASDQWQAKQAGYVARGRIDKAWDTVKQGALRGWVECTDGRLYHPVVAEKAITAWAEKQAQRTRTAAATAAATAAREAKRKAEQAARDAQPDAQRDDLRDVQRDDARDVHQGRVKGQGEGIDKPSSSPEATGKTPTIPCPYDAIVALYHEALPSLPRCRLMPAARQRAMRKVWGWVLSSTRGDGSRRAETAEQALDWLRSYFERASANDFLMGRSGRSAEHANWTPDLDFLLTDKGMKHVIEKTQDAA